MVDAIALRRFYLALSAWLQQREAEALAYLLQENRTRSLTDDQRRRLAVLGHRLGRTRLQELATNVTRDAILRWHRSLVARKWTYPRRRRGRAAVRRAIQPLVVRVAQAAESGTLPGGRSDGGRAAAQIVQPPR